MVMIARAKIVRLKDIPSQPTESFVDVCGQLKVIAASIIELI